MYFWSNIPYIPYIYILIKFVIMSFYEFRSEQTGSGSRSYIFKENKIIPFTNLFQQYIKNLSEWEIEVLSSYYREKCWNAYKIRKSVLLDFFLLILKYNGNHQYNTQYTEMLQYFIIAEQTFLNIYISYQP